MAKRDPIPSTRTINGKKWTVVWSDNEKQRAKAQAKRWRDKGYKARVVKYHPGWRDRPMYLVVRR